MYFRFAWWDQAAIILGDQQENVSFCYHNMFNPIHAVENFQRYNLPRKYLILSKFLMQCIGKSREESPPWPEATIYPVPQSIIHRNFLGKKFYYGTFLLHYQAFSFVAIAYYASSVKHLPVLHKCTSLRILMHQLG